MLSFHSGHGLQSKRSTTDQFSSFTIHIMKGEMKVQWNSISAICKLQKTPSYKRQDLFPYKSSGPYFKSHCFHLRSLHSRHDGVIDDSNLKSITREWHVVHTNFYENLSSGSNSWKDCQTHGYDKTLTLYLLLKSESRIKTTCLTPNNQGKILIKLLSDYLNVW